MGGGDKVQVRLVNFWGAGTYKANVLHLSGHRDINYLSALGLTPVYTAPVGFYSSVVQGPDLLSVSLMAMELLCSFITWDIDPSTGLVQVDSLPSSPAGQMVHLNDKLCGASSLLESTPTNRGARAAQNILRINRRASFYARTSIKMAVSSILSSIGTWMDADTKELLSEETKRRIDISCEVKHAPFSGDNVLATKKAIAFDYFVLDRADKAFHHRLAREARVNILRDVVNMCEAVRVVRTPAASCARSFDTSTPSEASHSGTDSGSTDDDASDSDSGSPLRRQNTMPFADDAEGEPALSDEEVLGVVEEVAAKSLKYVRVMDLESLM